MKNLLGLFFLLCLSCNLNPKERVKDSQPPPIALVIHGGAGTIKRSSMTSDKEKQYRETLSQALDTGYAILESGGESMDAVLKVIELLENSPLFNAGRGAVFTNEGTNELDASVMDGKTLMAGAVAGVRTIKNPILAAHAVMSKSPHVLLSGRGAEAFAMEQGIELVSPSYFYDSARFDSWQDALKKNSKFGTVGCVALDREGNIAAGTSTGGMTNKKYGRIGDSPIVGAGIYAKNSTCGISSTGWGEYFMRLAIAYDISALMEYKGISLEEASKKVIMEKLPALGGSGGVIGLTRQGEIAMVFNTEGMYRGYRKEGESARVFIYEDEY